MFQNSGKVHIWQECGDIAIPQPNCHISHPTAIYNVSRAIRRHAEVASHSIQPSPSAGTLAERVEAAISFAEQVLSEVDSAGVSTASSDPVLATSVLRERLEALRAVQATADGTAATGIQPPVSSTPPSTAAEAAPAASTSTEDEDEPSTQDIPAAFYARVSALQSDVSALKSMLAPGMPATLAASVQHARALAELVAAEDSRSHVAPRAGAEQAMASDADAHSMEVRVWAQLGEMRARADAVHQFQARLAELQASLQRAEARLRMQDQVIRRAGDE